MSRRRYVLVGLVLAKFIIQFFLISPDYDLHRDEFLHLDQARHLTWGYLSVPPVTSWISFLILLLGNGVFWIKFFPALFGALTMVVVWKAIEDLGGGWFALLLGTVSVLFSAILRINILYQPNSLDILCWTLFYWVLLRYIQSEDRKWLYAGAVVFGFAFLNKYNIVFLVLGLLPSLVLTRQRTVFLRRDFYLAVLVALILISPNLIWQYANGFPVFHHLNELAEKQLAKVERSGFLKEQLLFFFGSFFVLVAALISFFRFQPFRKFRIFFGSFLFTLLIFIYFRAKGYYAIGLYPILLVFGSVYLEDLLKEGWKIYLRPVLIAVPILLFVPTKRVAFPDITPAEMVKQSARYKALGLLRWEDGKDHQLPQDFADMRGWKELARKVDSAFYLTRDESHTLALCGNYGEAGAVNYYSKNKDMQAVSFNADYINWFPHNMRIHNLVVVLEDPADLSQEEKDQFESVRIIGRVEDPYAREKGTTIFLLQGARTDLTKAFDKIIEEKNRPR